MTNEIEMVFMVDGKKCGSSFITIDEKLEVSTDACEEEFYDVLRKGMKSFKEDSEEVFKNRILDNLTDKQTEILQEEHAKNYMGTDDDMPDAFDDFLTNLSFEELKDILTAEKVPNDFTGASGTDYRDR